MEWVETTGNSLEEAKEAALDQLGVAEDDAEFENNFKPINDLMSRLINEGTRANTTKAKDVAIKKDGSKKVPLKKEQLKKDVLKKAKA